MFENSFFNNQFGWERLPIIHINRSPYDYRIYSCISRPFITKIQPKKIALDLYTSHTQIPDQAIQEISITIAWSALGKPSFRNQF